MNADKTLYILVVTNEVGDIEEIVASTIEPYIQGAYRGTLEAKVIEYGIAGLEVAKALPEDTLVEMLADELASKTSDMTSIEVIEASQTYDSLPGIWSSRAELQ